MFQVISWILGILLKQNRSLLLFQVQLMSRDEQSILIVTYAELKHCLEQAFAELAATG